MATDSDNAIAVMLPGERRAVGIVAIIAMLRMFGLFALLPVLSLYAAQLADATPLLIGLAVGAYGLTQAGLQIPLGALSDRIGRVPVIVGGLIIGVGEKLAEAYVGPMVGGAIENWFAYVLALAFLLFRPQGLFGDKIIERI